jgi:hypothetical protein
MAFWIAGTALYQARGPLVFETTRLRYWSNFVSVPLVSAALCIFIFRWRGISPSAWASAALLIALPEMVGEAVVLSGFARFMPGMQAASAGRYGGFLFATYAVVPGVAEMFSPLASV